MNDEKKQETAKPDRDAGTATGFLKRRHDFFLNRTESIKWMLRGIVFIPITMVVDALYRHHRGTGSLWETMFMVFTLISLAGVAQFVIGLYGLIKDWIRNEEENDKPTLDR